MAVSPLSSLSFQPAFYFEGDLTFATVGAGQLVDQTVTVPTLYQNGFLVVSFPNLQDGLTFCNPLAPAANTLQIRWRNDTDDDIVPNGTGVKIVQL